MSVYDENISFLTQSAPRLLQLIDSISSSERCKTEPAKNGSLTLVYHHNGAPYYLHSKFDPEGESLKILHKKNLSADHIVVLGLGLGYHLEKLIAMKDKLSRVLLVEPDLEIVQHSLKTLRWNKLLNRRDFFYVLGPDLDNLALTMHRFIDIATFDTVEYIDLPPETRLLEPFFKKAHEVIENEIKTGLYDFKTRLAESYMSPRNVLKNLPLILKTRPIACLKNAFPGVPGFILSAGPSLDTNAFYLKKAGDRAVFIAVDTALKPLLKRSIQPHFVTVGDPSHKNYIHLQGTETEYRNFILAEAGIAHKVFRDFRERIFTLSIGKPIVRVLEANSEPLGEIEAWGSVISIALDAAVFMGLNPIIFVGQDFAFTGDRNHCRGASWEEQNMEYTRNLDDHQRFERQSIGGDKRVMETLDIFGNKTHTSERLILYKNYLARMLNKYPNTRFINATQGGIFSEIPGAPLYEVIKTFVYGKEPVDFNRLNRLPDLNKQDNIVRLTAFLDRTTKTFAEHLGRIKEALARIDKGGISSGEALPFFRFLEEVQQHIYAVPREGEILDMWSAAPIYDFLKDYKRIRNRELNESTIAEGLKIYKRYFRNIKPVVEDIIKQFEKTVREIGKL